MYALQLGPWLRQFRASQFLLVQKADLEQEPANTLRRVVSFLGRAPQPFRTVPKKPRRRDFGGKASLPLALQSRLELFFARHRALLARLIVESGVQITRYTPSTTAAYTNATAMGLL